MVLVFTLLMLRSRALPAKNTLYCFILVVDNALPTISVSFFLESKNTYVTAEGFCKAEPVTRAE